MADYNYLSLVNAVNERLNEVPLDDTNFLSAAGWYSQAKEAVNASVRMISQQEFEWPWGFKSTTMALTTGVMLYDYPEGSQSLNFDSFRLNRDVALNTSYQHLRSVDYEEVLGSGVDINNPRVAGTSRPYAVFRTPGLKFGVYPTPNAAYNLSFDWFVSPPELTDTEDVPFIPVQWKHVIVNGAMYFAYMFRGDPESSMVMKQLFDSDIKVMRKLYQNRYEYVRASAFQVGGNPFNAEYSNSRLGGI